MEQQGGDQLELFSDPQEDPKVSSNRAQRNSFGARIWRYEKVVLFIILFFTTAIVSFSLGVEKGRRSNAVEPENSTIKREPVKIEQVESSKPKAPLAVALKEEGKYTIQVASFKAPSYAKKEGDLLVKRGFKSFSMSKGKYTILCVGNFPDKESAQPLLSELRKYYKSCYIRRL